MLKRLFIAFLLCSLLILPVSSVSADVNHASHISKTVIVFQFDAGFLDGQYSGMPGWNGVGWYCVDNPPPAVRFIVSGPYPEIPDCNVW